VAPEIFLGASNLEATVASIGIALLSCALIAISTVLRHDLLRAVFFSCRAIGRGTPKRPDDWRWQSWVARVLAFFFLDVAVLDARRRTPAGVLRILIAVVLAIGASELDADRVHLRPSSAVADDEPRRNSTRDLAGRGTERNWNKSIGGRIIDYSSSPQDIASTV